MSMQLFTCLNTAKTFLALLLSVISTSVIGQTTITFDDQGYTHNASLGRAITIGNFEFSVVEQDLSMPASGDKTYYDIYYESSSEANGFGGSGLIYVGDQFDYDDPYYFIIKTVDGTEQQFQSFYIYDYVVNPTGVKLTAEAYRDGVLLGSQDLTIPASSKAVYTLGAVFGNVDEIRIRQQTPLLHPGFPGVVFAFDQFVIGSAVNNAAPTISGLPASIEIVENTRGALDITSSTFADNDSDEITAILSVSDGRIEMAATGGRPVVLAGHNTATVTVAGTPDAVNGYLDFASNLAYIPPTGLNGSPAAILTVSADDGSGAVELGTVPINISGANDVPTDISLSNSTVNRSAGINAPVGTLSSADADPGDTHTYTLVAGDGGDSNGSFNIDGSTLRASNASSLPAGTHSVRIRSTDSQGGIYEEAFAITVVGDLAITPGDPGNFITTWTAEDNGSGTYQITIPTTGTGYNYNVYWEEVGNASNHGTETGVTGDLTLTVPNSGTHKVEISGDFPRIYMAEFPRDIYLESRKLLSVEQWGDIAWTSMEGAFKYAENLRVNATDIPDLSRVTSIAGMFEDAVNFNAPIGNWDVSNVTDMSYLFEGAVTFNQDLGDWDVSNVTNMAAMFTGATNFNGDISGWNVGNVTSMAGMFVNVYGFNQDISGWDVSNVTDMTSMFRNATAFNQDISGWDVSKVTKLQRTFFNAAAFNQDISNWDVSNVTDMFATFSHAGSFNQDISSWEISNVITMGEMLDASGFSGENYDALLIGWAAQSNLPADITFGAEGLVYCAGAEARLQLIEDHGWTIEGDTPGCASMLIYVERETGSTIIIQAEASDAIQQVKQKIEDKTGISAATQQLSFAGEQLEDGRTLADYNIQNGNTLSLVVLAVNTRPVAVTDKITATEDIPVTGNVLTNDSDPEGDQLTASLVTAPVQGTVVLNADGSLTYTANHDYSGLDSLRYQVCDNGTPSLCDTAWAYFTTEGINDAPVITAPATIAVNEDAPAALTGISFADADAGSAAVAATFSTVAGTLAATSGGGVAVSGSGTRSLKLTGAIAALNTFIAASNLTFTTGRNATGDVTITVNIDDGGHTGTDPGNSGTGSSESDVATLTLAVTPVNDAPVNLVPAAQTVDGDESLVFSTGNGNQVSVSDADAGGGMVQVTLTGSHGRITLAGTSGLTFLAGDGTGNGSMAFEGSIADINAALNGMAFAPAAGYSGQADLQIMTDDLGLTGTGGAQTDTDKISIIVNPVNPVVLSVNASTSDGTYKRNDMIAITVTFNQSVEVAGGVPSLLLETGATDRKAVYNSGSGSKTLTFNYTVQAGDLSADLDYTSTTALALNGAAIQSGAGMDALLTLPAAGDAGSIAGQRDIVIDGVVPRISSVAVPANGYYREGDVLSFTLALNEPVNLNTTAGTPYLELIIGNTTVQAGYGNGSGTNALVFQYTVRPGEQDLDGVALGSNVVLNGGTIRDAAGNDAATALNNAAPTDNVFVYSAVPGVTLSTAANSPVNHAFTLSIGFTEPVTGFDLTDINVVNATLGNLQTADNITYTARVTPSANGAVSLSVPAGAARNIANIDNSASNTLKLIYDKNAPAVPQGLTATPRNGEHVINWTANTENDLAAYALYGGTGPAPTTLLARIAAPATTYTHTGVAAGETWYYRLRAIDRAGNRSGLSEEVSASVKIDQEITFAATASVVYGVADFDPGASSTNNSIEIVYSSSDEDIASIVAGMVHVKKTGIVTITANQEGNALYKPALPREQVLTISKAPITGITFTDAAFTYDGTEKSLAIEGALPEGASVSYENNGRTTSGAQTVIARLDGGVNYSSMQLEAELSVAKAPLTITAESKSRKFGEENPVFNFTYEGFVNGEDETQLDSLPSVSTEATPISPPGKYPLIAAGAAAANYAPRYIHGTLTIVPATRTITFPPLADKTYGDPDFDLTGQANTGETIIYSSSNTAVAEIVDGKIRITGAGTATISATLPENASYSNTPEISRELLVSKAPQEIHFAEIGQVQRDAGTLQLEVSASSGLPVQLEVSDNLVATLTGSSGLQVLRLGSTVITATQPGNANYLPATPAERELFVVDQEGHRVRVHQVVSPNSDGINDFLIVEGINDFPDNRLTIVNRNGISMFETKGYNNGSNIFYGKANTRVIGENLPAGTYFYLLEYRAGSETRRLKGWFVLKYQ